MRIIDAIKMKRQIHQCLLGASLLVIIPGALLGLLLTVGALGSGIEFGFTSAHFIAIPLLVLPSLLGWWGVIIFFRLYRGFLTDLRRMLFWFYTAVTAYCGIWLISTFNRDGVTGSIFAPHEQGIGLLLLLIPYLSVVLMTPDTLPSRPTGNDDLEQVGVEETSP